MFVIHVLFRVFRVIRGLPYKSRTTNHTKHTKKNTKQKCLKFSDNFVATWLVFRAGTTNSHERKPFVVRLQTGTTEHTEKMEHKQKELTVLTKNRSRSNDFETDMAFCK